MLDLSTLVIRYEHLACKPIEMSKYMFSKLDLVFTKRIEQWIERHTSGTDISNNPYSTIRYSKAMAFSWISRLNSSVIRAIESKCLFSYVELRVRVDRDSMNRKNSVLNILLVFLFFMPTN